MLSQCNPLPISIVHLTNTYLKLIISPPSWFPEWLLLKRVLVSTNRAECAAHCKTFPDFTIIIARAIFAGWKKTVTFRVVLRTNGCKPRFPVTTATYQITLHQLSLEYERSTVNYYGNICFQNMWRISAPTFTKWTEQDVLCSTAMSWRTVVEHVQPQWMTCHEAPRSLVHMTRRLGYICCLHP